MSEFFHLSERKLLFEQVLVVKEKISIKDINSFHNIIVNI